MITHAKKRHSLTRYLIDQGGVAAIIFAVMAPVILLSAGVAVDLGLAYNTRQRLSHAIDAGALAGTMSLRKNNTQLSNYIEDVVLKNFGTTSFATLQRKDIKVDLTNPDLIKVDAMATTNLLFMPIFIPKKTLSVSKNAVIQRDVNAEVVMVLDNSGSMLNGKNYLALEQGAMDLVNTLFGYINNMPSPSSSDLQIGLVGYAGSVNVGPYGVGLDTKGNYYGPAFVDNRVKNSGKMTTVPYDTNYLSDNWYGCVIEKDTTDTQDTITSFDPYRFCRNPSNDTNLAGGACTYQNILTNDGYCDNYKIRFNESSSFGKSCPKNWNTVNNVLSPAQDPYFFSEYMNPNYGCTRPLVPLTRDQNLLIQSIQSMEYIWGGTHSNYGMIWGERVISPNFPFTEGVSYKDPKVRKSIIFMTDGQTYQHLLYSHRGKKTGGQTKATLDTDLTTICGNLKNNNVDVYVITFTAGVSPAAMAIYSNCATIPSQMHYHAATQASLIAAFNTIAQQILTRRILK